MPVTVIDNGSRNRLDVPAGFLESQTGTVVFDGSDNTLVVGAGSTLHGGRIRLGTGCSVDCGRECRLASIEIHAAHGGHVRIGDGTGFTSHCRIYLHEPGEIVLGKACLVAGGTTLSVSDMHSIIEVETGRRLNPPRDIRLGDRVWLGEGVRVWKGASIGAGSVIGTESLVTKPIPENVIAAGVPARVIRTGVTWRHELLPCTQTGVPMRPVAAPPHHAGLAQPVDSVALLIAKTAPDPETFVRSIAPADGLLQMGRSHFHDDEVARLTYYRYGAWAVDDIRQVVNWRYGGFQHVPRLLEFACGFGQQTRYLVQHVNRERIWCSDADPTAVDFVRHAFGVQGFTSSRFPGATWCDDRFDMITALSLFGHLPRLTFGAILGRLIDLLSPGGLLVFSVQDAARAPTADRSPDGFTFIPHRTGGGAASVDSGTAFVTEEFVRRALDEGGAAGWPHLRLPRGLWSHQDLYLLVRDPDLRFESLRYRRGPEGCLERLEMVAPRTLVATGWVGDPDGAAEVRLIIDGDVRHACRPTIARPDVATSLQEPAYAMAGWTCPLDVDASDESYREAALDVVAVASDGRTRHLYAGRVGSALGRTLC